MKPVIKKVYKNLEEILGSILLVAMCIVAVLQVASRYVFGDQFSWTEETCTFLFVWLVFVGAAMGLKLNAHFAVDIIVEKTPRVISKILRFIILLLTAGFIVIVVGFGTMMVIHGAESITPALEIPKSFPYAAVPFGGILMAVRTCELFVRLLKSDEVNAQ